MRVVKLESYGGADSLIPGAQPDPEPAEGEAIVQVKAAGVNFADTLMREGRYPVNPELPAVLGSEVAGIVIAVGDNVTSVHVGARVAGPIFASGRLTGGYAEQVVLAAELLVPIPESLSFEDAVALQVQGLTAAFLLRQVSVVDRVVVVQAAAGGVGSILVQLAKAAGARRIIAMASSEAKRDLALSLGADNAVGYADAARVDAFRQLTGDEGVDVFFDAGASRPSASLNALSFGGDLMIYGSLSFEGFALTATEIAPLVYKNASIRGFALPTLLTVTGLHRELPQLFSASAEGDLRIVHGGQYPLDAAAEAHRALESRSSKGKLVLIP